MEFLRKYLLQTRNHLKGLTLSQRLAIGSCAAVIVVSILWLFQWGGKPELVPLLDQPMTAADIGAIENKLAGLGVEYKTVGNIIRVPAEQQSRLLAQLSQSQVLPKDTSVGFDKLIQDSSPWLGQNEQDWRRSVALGNELGKVIRHCDGVEEAQVFIGNNTRRTISGPPITPTASITIRTRSGVELDPQRAFALANIVVGAMPGLDIAKVSVTDTRTNRSVTPPSPEDVLTFGNDLADRQKKEEYFARQIREMLGVPGVLVAVRAELAEDKRREVQITYTKPVQISDKTQSMTQQRSTSAGGPGVVPNTSKAVAIGGPNDRTEENTSEGTYETKPSNTVTTESARNGLKSLAASVNVPRSYLAAIFRKANTNKEPTDADLKTTAQDEFKRITGQVRTILRAKDDSDAVSVGFYYDEALMQLGPGGTATAEAGTGTEIMTLVRTYGGKAGLGVLAAFSLLMMLMMVRKVSEGPVLPGEEPPQPIVRILTKKQAPQVEKEEELEEPEVLTVNAPPIGEAAAHEDLLVGREIDESTLRVQQVVQQVADLVKEDPKTSATILERWIQQDKS